MNKTTLDTIRAIGWGFGKVKFWLLIASWWPRFLLRPVCWWRSKHHGFYARGRWICRICSKQIIAAPPAGELIQDETGRAIYQTQPDGALRRVDKFRGTKKDRRRNREEVARLERVRQNLAGGRP